MNQQWSEFERAQTQAAQAPTQEALRCKCGCSWLYLVEVNRYSTQQVMSIQNPVPILGDGLPLLFCARCGEKVKANTYNGGTGRDKIFADTAMAEIFPSAPKPKAKPKAKVVKDDKTTEGVQDTKEGDTPATGDKG